MMSQAHAARWAVGMLMVGSVALEPARMGAQGLGRPTPTLTGFVTDRDQAPVPGAKVTLVIRGPYRSFKEEITATTGSDGSYKILLPDNIFPYTRHTLVVEAKGFNTRKTDELSLSPGESDLMDFELEPEYAITLEVAVGANRWQDNVENVFTDNFNRDFAQFDRECNGDDGGFGFNGGAIVSARVRSGFFFRGGADFQKMGSASFKCVATGTGPTRELTIDGSRDYTMVNFFVGPAVDIGPVTVFANVGATRWENEYDFRDQLLVNGQIVSGKRTSGETSGTRPYWSVGMGTKLIAGFSVSARFSRTEIDGLFPANTNRVPENAKSRMIELFLQKYFGVSTPGRRDRK